MSDKIPMTFEELVEAGGFEIPARLARSIRDDLSEYDQDKLNTALSGVFDAGKLAGAASMQERAAELMKADHEPGHDFDHCKPDDWCAMCDAVAIIEALPLDPNCSLCGEDDDSCYCRYDAEPLESGSKQ